jgi:hypothetical protein
MGAIGRGFRHHRRRDHAAAVVTSRRFFYGLRRAAWSRHRQRFQRSASAPGGRFPRLGVAVETCTGDLSSPIGPGEAVERAALANALEILSSCPGRRILMRHA